MTGITPFLWFNDNAEEAMRFYVSLFENARVLDVARCGGAGPRAPGEVMTVAFELNGQQFVGLNGGPHHFFTPAISFVVYCETQQEVDRYWYALGDGGEPNVCGWLTDRFGVSWQVTPAILPRLLTDKNQAKADSVMRAMLEMKKLDIAALQAAYDAC